LNPLSFPSPRAARFAAAVGLALAVLLAWSNSFSLGFVLDDVQNILDNPSIRDLTDLQAVLSGYWKSGIAGRPVTNLSFAVNWAISKDQAWSYHAANVLIHLLAALTLFAILRRSFLLPRLAGRFGAHALPLAFASTLLWAVHPLHTEAVTYVTQRLASMMGLFFLLTLYAALRSFTDKTPGRWRVLSALAFFLGAGAKETIVAAPAAVLLFDALLVRGGWREALSRDRRLFLGYLPGLAFLGVLLARGHTVGTALSAGKAFTPLTYALTQPGAVAHYLGLAFFPRGLMASAAPAPPGPHAWDFAWMFLELGPWVLVGGLLILAGVWIVRRQPLGVVAGWFFLTLAPTSSFLPLFCPVAERRMYLPLAALAVLAVLAGRVFALALRAKAKTKTRRAGGVVILALVLAAVALGTVTHLRNRDFASSLALWEDALNQEPDNAWIRLSLAVELLKDGQTAQALARFREALAQAPRYAEGHRVYGAALLELDREREGIAQLEEALRLDPDLRHARADLGLALARKGECRRAEVQVQAALALGHEDPEILKALGRCLAEGGDPRAAIGPLTLAAQMDPTDGNSLFMLGSALAQAGMWREAAETFRLAGPLLPGDGRPKVNEGVALARTGDRDGAVLALREALRVEPDLAAAHRDLGLLLAREGGADEAARHLEEALRLDPGDEKVLQALERLRPLGPVRQASPPRPPD